MKLLLPVIFALTAMNAFAQMPPPENLATPGVSHDLAKWRAAHYSDVRYKLNLTFEKMSPVLKGTIEIRVKVSGRIVSSAPGAEAVPEPIILDWRKIAGHEKDSTVTNITLNEIPLFNGDQQPVGIRPSPAFSYHEKSEHLILSDGVRTGENVIKLDFTSPILTSGSAITRYIDKEDGSEYIYSLFVPSDASTAFPVFDQPDLKARFQLAVNSPGDWTVVSNGGLEGISLSSLGNSHEFGETEPISTYVFAFAAGPWQKFSTPGVTNGNPSGSEGVSSPHVSKGSAEPNANPRSVEPSLTVGLRTHYFVRKSKAAKFQPHAAEVFKLTREGVKYLEDYFDYKFPWPKYDIVLIPEFPFGGMEHAGATFLRESGVIFPSEPTKNDQISRATLIFHETAHQWFGDTVTMRWFDDLWLKEGFANFMAYKTLEKVMPEMNAWKSFYERIKQPAYATDSTKGTTPIYQEIKNLSAAKSAYGNIVYNKAPAFLRQAEFYLGPDKFQTAVRAFLKKHEYANASWQDLVSEFVTYGKVPPTDLMGPKNSDLAAYDRAERVRIENWAKIWVSIPGVPIFRAHLADVKTSKNGYNYSIVQESPPGVEIIWPESAVLLTRSTADGKTQQYDKTITFDQALKGGEFVGQTVECDHCKVFRSDFIFPNYQDYGYGIFLLDDKSRDYVLKNIQNEKDDFLRSMMWGALWDSVREAELDPRQYVELAIKDLPTEKDETITASVLGRVSTAMTYYLSEPPASAGGQKPRVRPTNWPAANAAGSDLGRRLESMLIDRMQSAPTLGQRITYYRAFLNIVSTENGRNVLKAMLRGNAGILPAGPAASSRRLSAGSAQDSRQDGGGTPIPLKTKDRFDIVARLAILGDPDAAKLLADLEKTETSDDAKRYAYAAHAAFATKENREKFWNDFVTNKDISESWIEAAFGPFNSPRHSDLSLPYLQRALAELPNLKRTRKIFFINGWLGAFIGGQKSQEALDIVNKFLADNPNLDRDLRLKILENSDIIERAVKIRSKYSNN